MVCFGQSLSPVRATSVGSEVDQGMSYASKAQLRTRRWRKLRGMVLRGEPLCRLCSLSGRVVAATEVDHIMPRERGGPMWEVGNLQPLCRSCHREKTDRELGRMVIRALPGGHVAVERPRRMRGEPWRAG